MDAYNPKKHKLEGLWVITRKIDGIQAVYGTEGEAPVSRKGKPLWNLPQRPPGTYEVFIKDWSTTASLVRTRTGGKPLLAACLYQLEPEIDPRLHYCESTDPSPEKIQVLFEAALKAGYEGLVLRGPSGQRLKVKNSVSYDVPITAVLPGKGKNAGKMGSLLTPMGRVGTGFSDRDRIAKWNIGELIEVECMELTEGGKFRHPRFIRRRFDK
jgi:hypothetical protein